MSKQVKWRRGTTAEHSTFTGAIGEVTVDTTKDTLVVHDGVTRGGHSLPEPRDWRGFTDALLAEAGIVDDGLPDTASNSQRVESIITLIEKMFTSEVNRNNAQGLEPVNYLTEIMRRDFKFTVRYPSWSHRLPINIYWKGGKYFTDFDIASLKPERPQKFYVDICTGNNANNGLSKSTPFKTLNYALSQSGDNEIELLRSGKYYYKDGWMGIDPARGISVVCPHGQAILTNDLYPRNWVEDPLYAGLWSTKSNANGENLTLLEAASSIRFIPKGREGSEGPTYGMQLNTTTLANLQTGTVGRIVGVDNTYVRLPFNENPNNHDSFSLVYALDNVVVHCNDMLDHTIYLEGITAHYGSNLAPVDIQTSSNNSKILLNRCESTGSRASNGFNILGNGLCVNYRGRASGAYKDGFNYHVNSPVSGSTEFNIVEIECKSRSNGSEAGGLTHNGSTFHSTIKGIRLNCDHSYNRNRNIHDVGGLCQSFNVGCTALGSWTSMAGIQAGFDDGSDSINMWLVGCNADKILVGAGASTQKLYTSNDTVAGTIASLGGVLLDYYP